MRFSSLISIFAISAVSIQAVPINHPNSLLKRDDLIRRGPDDILDLSVNADLSGFTTEQLPDAQVLVAKAETWKVWLSQNAGEEDLGWLLEDADEELEWELENYRRALAGQEPIPRKDGSFITYDDALSDIQKKVKELQAQGRPQVTITEDAQKEADVLVEADKEEMLSSLKNFENSLDSALDGIHLEI